MKFGMSVDPKQIERLFGAERKRQINQASARALTAVAFDARKEVQRKLPQWLKITRRFFPSSVVYRPAKAQDGNRMHALIGFLDRARYVMLMEEGGTRKPQGRSIAIPSSSVKRSARGTITKANKPRSLLAKRGSFIAIIGGNEGIYQRDRSGKLKLLYSFKKRTKYKRGTIHFKRTVEKVVKKKIASQLEYWLSRTLKRTR